MGQTQKGDTRLFSLPSIIQSCGEWCKLVQEEGKLAWWTEVLEATHGLGITSWLFYLWKGNKTCWTLCMIFGIGRNMWSLLFMVWTWNARVSLRLKAGESELFKKKKKFFFLAIPCSMQDLSSLTRNWTHAPCSGSTEFQPLDLQESPSERFLEGWMLLFSELPWMDLSIRHC